MLRFVQVNEKSEALTRFISNHPRGSIFQSPSFLSIHKNCPNLCPFSYAVQDEDKNILGAVSGIIHSNYFWPVKTLTKRAIITGGPLIKDDDMIVLDFLLGKYNKTMKSQGIYSQFRNNWEQVSEKQTFFNNRYKYEDHLDITIDLDREMEEILAGISRNKRRNVTKSFNKGSHFREIKDRDEYIKSLDLIYQTYSRIRLPVSDRRLFLNAFDILGPRKELICFGSFLDDRCIGIRIELLYKECIYDWYAGSDEAYKTLNPNDLLIYNVLKWGKEQHFKEFRFGGAGKPGVPYGVRDYKMKFGGKLVELGRYELVHQKLRYFIGNFAHQVLHRK